MRSELEEHSLLWHYRDQLKETIQGHYILYFGAMEFVQENLDYFIESLKEEERYEDIQEADRLAEIASELASQITSDYKKLFEENQNIIDEILSFFNLSIYSGSSEYDIDEADIEKAEQRVFSFEKNLEKVDIILEEIGSKFTIKDVSVSRKSVSTYVKIPVDKYEGFKKLYEGIANFDNVDEEILGEEETFTVRISDHNVGGYTSEYTQEFVSYAGEEVLINADEWN